jgi:hypothetical protein
MKFHGILSEQLDAVWNDVKPCIQKALDEDHNRTNIETVYKNIKSKAHQLWVANDGCFCVFVSCIEVFDNAKQLKLLYCGGEFGSTTRDERQLVFNVFKEYAISQGCTELEIWGRDGWLKICPELEKDYTVMRLPLWVDQAEAAQQAQHK